MNLLANIHDNASLIFAILLINLFLPSFSGEVCSLAHPGIKNVLCAIFVEHSLPLENSCSFQMSSTQVYHTYYSIIQNILHIYQIITILLLLLHSVQPIHNKLFLF